MTNSKSRIEAAMEILHDEFGIKRLDGDSAGGLPTVFSDDGKGRPGEEADGLEREECGEGRADARRDFPGGDYGS